MTYIAFPHVEGHWPPEEAAVQRELAQIMIASCRRAMPDVPIKMITNDATPPIPGVDEVLRRPTRGMHWIPWMCDFCAELDGEVLYLDTDIIVQRDLRPLFKIPADIVLTWRGEKVFDGRNMPFLLGVVAYRNKDFWAEVRDRTLAMADFKDLGWWGAQVAVYEMWMDEQGGRGKWNIQSVSCDVHNYTPKTPVEMPKDKWVLHYKGKKRKDWMLANWRHLLEEKVAA